MLMQFGYYSAFVINSKRNYASSSWVDVYEAQIIDYRSRGWFRSRWLAWIKPRYQRYHFEDNWGPSDWTMNGAETIPVMPGSSLTHINVIGASDVGKTTLIESWLQKQQQPIEGINIHSELIYVLFNGWRIEIYVHDFNGMASRPIQLAQTHPFGGASILVFDVNDRSTYELIPQLIEIIDRKSEQNGVTSVIYLAGNKTDQGERCVSSLEARNFATSKGIDYIEVSMQPDRQSDVDKLFFSTIALSQRFRLPHDAWIPPSQKPISSFNN
eukprot:TRINITY_DN2227_c0_g1_i2.p1 TRINITY_DN2227_c0_g1~~TRINITY_DN2227_c0_g1_i2.p1  ORF type:complete len:270 (-),score=40.93 TRINITY_DN2227_c0_g1_i2:56-865(-)